MAKGRRKTTTPLLTLEEDIAVENEQSVIEIIEFLKALSKLSSDMAKTIQIPSKIELNNMEAIASHAVIISESFEALKVRLEDAGMIRSRDKGEI